MTGPGVHFPSRLFTNPQHPDRTHPSPQPIDSEISALLPRHAPWKTLTRRSCNVFGRHKGRIFFDAGADWNGAVEGGNVYSNAVVNAWTVAHLVACYPAENVTPRPGRNAEVWIVPGGRKAKV